MRKLLQQFTLILTCVFCAMNFSAYAIRYFPITVSAPYAGTAQTVCQGASNTATTVTYTVCGSTSGGAGANLTVTPKWYLNGVLVFTGTTFTSTAGGGTVTLPAGSFTYSTIGAFTGVNGLACELSWTTASPTGCVTSPLMGAKTDIYVTTAPGPISGVASVCTGATIALTNTTIAGTWSSSAPAVGTVTATGIVTGVTGGTTNITYSTGCGAAAVKTVTVTAGPPPTFSGSLSVCTNGSTTLSSASASGTWSSSNPSTATVSSTGVVTGGPNQGTTIISYTTGCGSPASQTFTVVAAPTAIGGATKVCSGSSITLSNASLYGTWTSSATPVASVTAQGGDVTGGNAGVAVITYATGCGAARTITITTVASPAAISGQFSLCTAQTTTLSNTTAGGSWSSSNSAIASIGSATGFVTAGATQGLATITYSTGCGSDATKTFTVIANPGGINGPATVCSGQSIMLSDAAIRGTWSSGNTAIASVNANTGVVTGGNAGKVVITYGTGCGAAVTTTITTIAAPVVITGLSSVCTGSSISLTNSTVNGTWSSSNTTVASVDGLGAVAGNSQGGAVITYSTGCGTAMTKTVTVYTTPGAISGLSEVCEGFSVTLSNSALGGTWSSDNVSIATITTAGGVVSGLSAGTTDITYSTGCGTPASITFTVNPQPLMPGSIGGIMPTLCTGSSINLTNPVGGGIWSTNSSATATIDPASGVLTGVSAGPVIVSYTIATVCNSHTVTTMITIQAPLPVPAPISGSTTVCEGSYIYLTDVTPGGAWEVADTTIAAVTTTGATVGIAGGTTTVSYVTTNICGSSYATMLLTVNPLPVVAPITGYTAAFCQGTTLPLSNATPGGVWSSNITSVATVSSMGVVTGTGGGNTTIFYSVTNGCGTVPASIIISVDPLSPVSAIGGPTDVCIGGTITLSDGSAGGTWSSGTPGTATVANSGTVTGVAPGTAIITYTIVNSCGASYATRNINVIGYPDPGIISGGTTVCAGEYLQLSNSVGGGTWSSDFPSVAMVNASGTVYAVGGGADVIRYTVSNLCGPVSAQYNIMVLPTAMCTANVPGGAVVAVELRAMPNPSDGAFTVTLLSDKEEDARIIITNVTGQQVIAFSTKSNRQNSLQIKTPGMYIISAVTEHGKWMSRVIVR